MQASLQASYADAQRGARREARKARRPHLAAADEAVNRVIQDLVSRGAAVIYAADPARMPIPGWHGGDD